MVMVHGCIIAPFFKRESCDRVGQDQGSIVDHLDAYVDDSLEELMAGMELRDDESE